MGLLRQQLRCTCSAVVMEAKTGRRGKSATTAVKKKTGRGFWAKITILNIILLLDVGFVLGFVSTKTNRLPVGPPVQCCL